MSAAPETLPATDASRRPPEPLYMSPVTPPPHLRHPHPAPPKHVVHWFRKGLRLHDNPALRAGLANATTFRCVFIIDPWFASTTNVGINKWRFLLDCLEDLDYSLRKLNSRLFVVRGQPADALPKLFQEWGTTALSFEEDPEPYGRVRDHNIMSKCRECGISVTSRASHTLYKLDKIIERNGGKAPLTYHQFQALIASMPPPPSPEPVVNEQALHGAITPLSDDHNERFSVPTLEELGFDTDELLPPVWIGGESEALARLEKHLERKAWVASFGRPKMTPQSLLASQTGLSPYLRFGCLSTRLFYYQLTDLYKRIKRVRPPLSLHGQILWREFFYCAATRNPNFDRMEGNPICVQIPWQKNSDALAKWANGTTGFPWIDAIMIQLREEGWIHHLARHAVACFLTRGDLWISWEEGMKVFDELLLDADWSVNAGTWMWLSCSSFFQQFFHCYCPVRFGRKTDPDGEFIRRYIPALRHMPSRYIHEPWVAPEPVQLAARCVVGRDYPLPMVDHRHVSQINIERIKQVYALLAKFKPQGGSTINPQHVLRPSVTQSSPSPTSIIRSINQSSFLCSQSPDPPPAQTYKVAEVFQLPVSDDQLRPEQPPLKEIVIIQQPQNSNVSIGNITYTQPRPISVTNDQAPNYKVDHKIGINAQPIHQNCEFKNVAIHNYVAYPNTEVYPSPPMPNELYEQVLNINNFGLEKSKYYVPNYQEEIVSTGRPRNRSEPATSPVSNYNRRPKSETAKEENDVFLDQITANTEGFYTPDNDNNEADS